MTAASVLNLNLILLCLITQVLFLLSPNVSTTDDLDRFTKFDWGLSKIIGESINDNVVISPISIKVVLAMLYQGSAGNTSKQLEQALGLRRLERTSTILQFSQIYHILQQDSPDYELDIGTKLFIDKNTHLNEHYNRSLTTLFNASLEKVDFSKPDLAAKAINIWAANVTKGHIQQLISEADTKESIALLLLNAIYFKGHWLQPFPDNQTRDGKFRLTKSKMVTTEFMNCLQKQRYGESNDLDASIIRLEYMGDKFAMYIILPNDIDGLDKLLKLVSPDVLREVLKTMEEVDVKISLPKFQFDFATSLRPALQNLGLYDMFSENADLSGITNNKTDNLMVSDVIQKAGILVNEQGSTAYVATQVELVSKFGEHVTSMVIDHPFLFFIQDERTQTIVFVGKVVNPNPAGKIIIEKVEQEMSYSMTPMITQPINNSQNSRWNKTEVNKPVTNGNKDSMLGNSHSNEPGWNTGPGGLEEHSTNFGQEEYYSNSPNEPPASGFKYPESGYFSSDGEYVKQNFDQERNTFFDTELIQSLCESETSNWVVSTASIKTLLSMIYEGAAAATESDLATILRLPMNKTRALRTLHSIQRELHSPSSPEVKWLMANRLLVSAKLPTLPEYNQAMKSMYHARVDVAKFENAVATANDVNYWINSVTQGFIPTLLNAGSLDKDSQLILLNAVYFKGNWLFPFNNLYSQRQCFYPQPNLCKPVKMMSQRMHIKYGFHKQLVAHVFELPYADQRFSMIIVLPEAEGGLDEIMRNLPFCPLIPFLNDASLSEVQLSLPTFSVEFSKDLTTTISKMGNGSMFSDKADLRNMIGNRRGKISKIIHKAKIIVNEQGTEAGAGTAGIIVPLMNTQLVQITVNQPFLFYIRDQRSGYLFAGRISDPS